MNEISRLIHIAVGCFLAVRMRRISFMKKLIAILVVFAMLVPAVFALDISAGGQELPQNSVHRLISDQMILHQKVIPIMGVLAVGEKLSMESLKWVTTKVRLIFT
jgi:uncharacterized membrane protein